VIAESVQSVTIAGRTSVSWPHRVGIVPQLADRFQTRTTVDELTAATDAGGTAVHTAANAMLLSGMGGVGKTQLAAYLAEQMWHGGQVDLLVWISATSRQAILGGYAHAACDLALAGADGGNTEQDAARFHAWLSTADRRWMIVLDDLTSTGDLQGLWPPTCRAGRTVVTTRLRGSALHASGRRLVQVATFNPREATSYVRARLADDHELADEVDGVAEDLGYLPLALAQATAFMVDEQVSCSLYRQRFADRRARLDDVVPEPDALPDDYDRTLAATLSLSVEAADRSRPVGLARPLLELASVLDSAGIPVAVFTTTAALNWLTYRRSVNHLDISGDADARLIRSGLRCLHRFNLININAGGDLLTAHGLVQRATREAHTDEHVAEVAWAAADALAEVWPPTDHDSACVRRLRSNTTAAYRHGQAALLYPYTHSVLYTAINSLGTIGSPTGAAIAFEQLLEDQLRVLGPDHPDTLATRGNLARWHGEAGDPAGAAQAAEQLLVDLLRVLGPDHPDTLGTRSNLAHMRGDAGDPAGAATALEQLLEDQLRVLGPDHPDTLATRGNLARWHGEAGDPAGAAQAALQLLADHLRVLGPDHPDTLSTRSHLAGWRGQAGDLAGAATALEQLLEDQLRVLGPDHPETLNSRSNLAYMRGAVGDPAGAATALEQLLEDQLQVLGPDHPNTLSTQSDLARWRWEAGDPAGAATALEQLLADQLRVLGPEHPETLNSRSKLAVARGQAGDPAGAATALEQLLADQLRVLGPDHPHTLATRGNLAYMRGEAGDPAAAATALEQLLADQLRVLGPDHPHTLATRGNLARWRGVAGDPAAAATALVQLLADVLRVLGPDHPHTLATRGNLAYWQGEVDAQSSSSV